MVYGWKKLKQVAVQCRRRYGISEICCSQVWVPEDESERRRGERGVGGGIIRGFLLLNGIPPLVSPTFPGISATLVGSNRKPFACEVSVSNSTASELPKTWPQDSSEQSAIEQGPLYNVIAISTVKKPLTHWNIHVESARHYSPSPSPNIAILCLPSNKKNSSEKKYFDLFSSHL